MKKITWVQILSNRYGGRIYGEKVRKILSKDFEIETKNIEARYLRWRYFKPIEWFFKLLKLRGESDLWIRDDFNTIFMMPFNKTKGKNLALIYHIDFSISPLFLRFIFFFLANFFYSALKKTDVIVTVSEYWKNYFLEKGYSNVKKIYCGFNLGDFEIKDEEIEEFKNRFGLSGKPIIYIGNCQKVKGVVEAYNSLKDLDAFIVTSGEKKADIQAKNLNLDYKDYLRLLKASSVAVTMSKFKEGWCMTAHEAMLCKTPVIGSGFGGMKELLNEGKQIVCKNFAELRGRVEFLLKNYEERKKMGEDGYLYAKNFTMDKFEKEWLNLIKKIIK